MTPLYFKYRINVRNDEPIEEFVMDFTEEEVTPAFIANKEAEIKYDLEREYADAPVFVLWVTHVEASSIPFETLNRIHQTVKEEFNTYLDSLSGKIKQLNSEYYETRRMAFVLERITNDKKGTDSDSTCGSAKAALSPNCDAKCGSGGCCS